MAGSDKLWRERYGRVLGGRVLGGYLAVGLLLVVVLPVLVFHRIALALDLVLFPGLKKVVVRRPLFVVGPPRSGTTLMHRLLAENDKQFTTFRLWELLFAPALSEKYLARGIARFDRFVGSPLRRLLTWAERKFSESLDGVHQTSLFLPEEDYLALLCHGGCFLAVLVFPRADWVWRLGNFSSDLSAADQQRLVVAYRGLLQRHLYFRGEERVVLSKNPTFCAWLPKLVEVFPDARFIGLLRSPAEIVPSQLSSVRSGMDLFGNDVRDPQIRDSFVALLAGYYRQVGQVLSSLPVGRASIVEYRRLKTSSDEVVIECLRQFEYQCSKDYQESMRLKAGQVSGYRSGHRYTLADFGLTASDIEKAFGGIGLQHEDTAVKGEVIHS